MRIFTISFASVYPHYVTKVEKKGRTKAELAPGDRVADRLRRAGADEHLAEGHDVRGLLRGAHDSTRTRR